VATCWAAQTKLCGLHVARGCSHFYKKSQLSIAFSCLRMAPWSVSYPQHPSCTCMAGYTPGICFCRHKVISTGSSMKIRSKNAKDLKLSWCLCERYLLVFLIHTLSKYAATACILYQRFYITLFVCEYWGFHVLLCIIFASSLWSSVLLFASISLKFFY
jgi:hypothetical protein